MALVLWSVGGVDICQEDVDCDPDGWKICFKPLGLRNFKLDADLELLHRSGICKHKPLFPMKELEFWGMAAVYAILWYSNLGGAAGAGLVVPIAIYFFKFDAKNAITLSNFSTLLSSTVRLIAKRKWKHPLKAKQGAVIIDYDLGAIMLPAVVSGVSIGAIMNIIAPQIIVTVFYILLMALALARGLVMKTVRLWREEN